jgi:hypothetical protein
LKLQDICTDNQNWTRKPQDQNENMTRKLYCK